MRKVTRNDLYAKFSRQRVKGIERFLDDNRKVTYDRQGHPVYGDVEDLPVFLTYEGMAEVEARQWFNLQFVILQILLPVCIAIITTALTRALWP